MTFHRPLIRRMIASGFECSRAVLFGLFAIGTLFGAKAPAPLESQLPELARILDSARANAPDLLKQDLLQAESERRLKQAKSAYYPRLDVITNFGYRQDYRTGAENTSSLGLTYSANLTRPIYRWGSIEAQIEQARIGNNTNSLNFANNLRAIERRIRADYLNLIINNLSLENERQQKEILEAKRTETKINFEAGKLSALAFNDFELNLKSHLLHISQIEQSKRRIAERFKFTAGTEVTISNEITEIPLPDLDQTERWLEQQVELIEDSRGWLNGNYASQLKQNEIRLQEEQITLVKARQRPLIDAAASATQNETNTSTQNNVDTFSVFAGIRVSWNIFDGFRTRNEKIEATTKLRRLEMELAHLSDELKLQALESLDQLRFQVRRLKIQEASFENRQADFQNSVASAESGRISQKQLNDAQLKLGRENLGLQQQRAAFVMALNNYQDLVEPVQNELTFDR